MPCLHSLVHDDAHEGRNNEQPHAGIRCSRSAVAVCCLILGSGVEKKGKNEEKNNNKRKTDKIKHIFEVAVVEVAMVFVLRTRRAVLSFWQT